MQLWASRFRGFALLVAITTAGVTALGWPLYAPASGALPFSAAAVLTIVILPITVPFVIVFLFYVLNVAHETISTYSF